MAEAAQKQVYVESSFLISVYSLDANSPAAAAAMTGLRAPAILTPLVELEVVNALQQRVFWRQVTGDEAQKSRACFEADLRGGVLRLVSLPERTFARASAIAQQTTAALGTRTIDLLHVAGALELGASHLYSFDERQRRLAQTMHLKLNRL